LPRILILDDSPTQAVAAARVARDVGWEAVIVHDPVEAFSRLSTGSHDALLADVRMPRMSGYEVTRRVRRDARLRDLTVLLMTHQDDPGDVVEGLACGADSFLKKPIDADTLSRRLGDLQGRDGDLDDAPPVRLTCLGRAVDVTAGRERVLSYLAASFEDLALARSAEEQARGAAENAKRAWRLLESCLDALPTAIGILDEEGRVIGTNSAWQGASPRHPLLADSARAGSDLLKLLADVAEDRSRLQTFGAQLGRVLVGERRRAVCEGSFDGGDGEHWFEASARAFDAEGRHRVVVAVEDTTALKEAEERLIHDAFYDSLTGLPNRTLLHERLGRAIARAARRDEVGYALLFIDLDGFKLINDSLGHGTGDAVLVELGRRLLAGLRPTDTASRLGGDEFTVLVEPAHDHATVLRVARRLQAAMARPMQVGEHEIVMTASIGVALADPSYRSASELLRDADIAMYRAKSEGRGRIELFDAAMHDGLVERLRLESELRGALAREELDLHYQPIVTLTDATLVGFEALLRWRHPELGSISPARFIPIAEETGLIVPIGAWVVEEACRQLAAWRSTGLVGASVGMNVNLSARQFTQGGVVQDVRRALERSGLPSSTLHLELTETVILGHSDTVRAAMDELRALGIRLAMDDFGTGYSSLNYLRRFPFDTLKIDRSFLQGVAGNPEDAQIVHTILLLAEAMNLAVVAEGVETEDQRQALMRVGCTIAQGYLFARPGSASDLTQWLGERDR